ncbi:MAG: FAD-binding oxidoreductase [Kineosporiaceae bacterium]
MVDPVLRVPSEPVPERAEVVVVGGGVMGASIAFHLAEAGVSDVLLLERDALASGSTSKAAGGVRAQFSDALNVILGARSLEAFERFRERPGNEIDLHQVGYLFLLTTPEDVATYEASVALQNSLGVGSRMISAREAGAMTPILSMDGVLAAAFHARDGYCSPESVVQGYASGARGHGATVVTDVEVTGIERDGATITGVQTSAGRVGTSTVVNCAGPWAGLVAAMAGIDLPVTPLRRQIVVTEPLPAALRALVPPAMPMTIEAASTFYLHPEGRGMLMGMSYVGEEPGFRMGMSDDWLPDLTEAMERRAPALLDVGMAHGWSGLYEDSPDHNALIGESSEVSRFFYVTGFSGHGFLQGPAVGEVVRDLYLGREPFVDIGPLSADRFTAGTARPEHNIV